MCIISYQNNFSLCIADDIEVVFYETDMDTGKRPWEGQGVFSPTDVHRQVGTGVM